MSFSQTNFLAELDGTTANQFMGKLDFKITNLQGRKDLIETILNNTEYFTEYFSHYFKAGITTREALSSDVNVCRVLNSMANYLLNSKEIKQMDDEEETKYVFYTDPKHFEKKVNREMSIEALAASSDGADNLIHFLKASQKNHKKPKEQKILKKDLNRNDFLGEVLRSYQSFADFLTAEIKKGKESKFNRFTLTKIKGQVENDMIYSKDHLLGVWGYDLKSAGESTVFNVDVFDFTNVEHLHGIWVEKNGKKVFEKGLLYFKRTDDLQNDFNLVLVDLENVVKQANLTQEELLILEAVQNGLPKKVVAKLLDTNPMKITRTMVNIAEKVASLGNKYDAEEITN